MGSRGLVRTERMHRRSDFIRAYKQGARVHARYMTLFMVGNTASHPRLGIAVTRRLGSAVGRNRAKRLVRELFRRHKNTVAFSDRSGVDVVVVPRREILDAPFPSLEADYTSAVRRCGKPRPRR